MAQMHDESMLVSCRLKHETEKKRYIYLKDTSSNYSKLCYILKFLYEKKKTMFSIFFVER
jgi:hypothetical protein